MARFTLGIWWGSNRDTFSSYVSDHAADIFTLLKSEPSFSYNIVSHPSFFNMTASDNYVKKSFKKCHGADNQQFSWNHQFTWLWCQSIRIIVRKPLSGGDLNRVSCTYGQFLVGSSMQMLSKCEWPIHYRSEFFILRYREVSKAFVWHLEFSIYSEFGMRLSSCIAVMCDHT